MCYFLLKTSNYLSDIKVPHTLHHGCMAPAARSAENAKYTSQGGGGGGLDPPRVMKRGQTWGSNNVNKILTCHNCHGNLWRRGCGRFLAAWSAWEQTDWAGSRHGCRINETHEPACNRAHAKLAVGEASQLLQDSKEQEFKFPCVHSAADLIKMAFRSSDRVWRHSPKPSVTLRCQ